MQKKPNEEGFVANDVGRKGANKNVIRLLRRPDCSAASIALAPHSARPTACKLIADDDDPGPTAA